MIPIYCTCVTDIDVQRCILTINNAVRRSQTRAGHLTGGLGFETRLDYMT